MKQDLEVLQVRGLHTQFQTPRGIIKAVDGIDLDIHCGEVLGIVGESGCGKSVTAFSIMGLIDPPGMVTEGSIKFEGIDLLSLTEKEMARLRGDRIAMIFQQPQAFLNPIYKVHNQVEEIHAIHGHEREVGAFEMTKDLLVKVGIPDPECRANAYPHELSGGMAQRVMIAMAVSNRPSLLIADEPTTALDVTIQAQILDLLRELRRNSNTAVILITHDLGIIAELADQVAVMYAGQIVEKGDVHSIFSRPAHPYTSALLRSLPILGRYKPRLEVIPGSVPELHNLPRGCHFAPRCMKRIQNQMPICIQETPPEVEVEANHMARCWFATEEQNKKFTWSTIPPMEGAIPEDCGSVQYSPPLVEPLKAGEKQSPNGKELVRVEHLIKHFPIHSGLFKRTRDTVHALNDVSFKVASGETLGLVGESGCGKTTLGRIAVLQLRPTAGEVWFEGRNIVDLKSSELKRLRRDMQFIFQNAYTSLNPRVRIGESVAEGLLVQGMRNREQRREIVVDTLKKVGIMESCIDRYPHEFSGGQLQRIGIARALALHPKFLVCDEPVSALDVSIRSQVLNLLHDIQDEFGLTYLFIAHDLAVIEHISDHVAVMYLGNIVEYADRDELFRSPLHPYTQALMSAIPIPDPDIERKDRIILEGDVPSPVKLPKGCCFYNRCKQAMDICRENPPVFKEIRPGHSAACWLAT